MLSAIENAELEGRLKAIKESADARRKKSPEEELAAGAKNIMGWEDAAAKLKEQKRVECGNDRKRYKRWERAIDAKLKDRGFY